MTATSSSSPKAAQIDGIRKLMREAVRLDGSIGTVVASMAYEDRENEHKLLVRFATSRLQKLAASIDETGGTDGIQDRLRDVIFSLEGYGELIRSGVSHKRILRHFLAKQIKAAAEFQRTAIFAFTPEGTEVLAKHNPNYSPPAEMLNDDGSGLRPEHLELLCAYGETMVFSAVFALDSKLAQLLMTEKKSELLFAILAWIVDSRDYDSRWHKFWELCEAVGLPTTQRPKDIARDIAKLDRMLGGGR